MLVGVMQNISGNYFPAHQARFVSYPTGSAWAIFALVVLDNKRTTTQNDDEVVKDLWNVDKYLLVTSQKGATNEAWSSNFGTMLMMTIVS
jgi:hypothetical protein